jgi:hypothetical protein
LSLTELAGGDPNLRSAGAVYGVEGCGHRATYVQPERGTWIMNTADGQPGKAASGQK